MLNNINSVVHKLDCCFATIQLVFLEVSLPTLMILR